MWLRIGLGFTFAIVTAFVFGIVYNLYWPERARSSDDTVGYVLPMVLLPTAALAGFAIGGVIERRRRPSRAQGNTAGDATMVVARRNVPAPDWVDAEPGAHPRVTYQVTEDDVCAFALHHTRAEQGKGLLATYLVVLAVVFAINVPGAPLIVGILPVLMTAVVLPIGFRWAVRYHALQWAQQTPGTLGEIARQLTPEGMRSWSPVWGEALLSWNAIVRIVGTPEYILLYRNPHQADLIPTRAFADPEAAESFLRTAREWHATATGAAPAPPPS